MTQQLEILFICMLLHNSWIADIQKKLGWAVEGSNGGLRGREKGREKEK